MIGVGHTDMAGARPLEFCKRLGADAKSWGYNYNGVIHHNGKPKAYGQTFDRGSIVGVHLDMFRGTLEYYLDRRPLGKINQC